MKIVVSITSSPEDIKHLSKTIDSIQSGLIQPIEILVTLTNKQKYTIPDFLRRKKGVRINRIDQDYGALNGLVGFTQQYKLTEDVHCVLVSSTCQYPRNLLSEYVNNTNSMDAVLKEKISNFTGAAYGLAGIVIVPNKKRVLDMEFNNLISGKEEKFEQRTMIGYIKDNATVDVLETFGTILLHRRYLEDDFIVYLDRVQLLIADSYSFCTDMLLSNYLTSKGIIKTQLCNLNINRFMLDSGGFTEKRKSRSKSDKEQIYLNTVNYLRAINSFKLWE